MNCVVAMVVHLTVSMVTLYVAALHIHISKQTYIALQEHGSFNITLRGEMSIKVCAHAQLNTGILAINHVMCLLYISLVPCLQQDTVLL